MSSFSRALCLLLLPAFAAAVDDREGRVDAAVAVDAILSGDIVALEELGGLEN